MAKTASPQPPDSVILPWRRGGGEGGGGEVNHVVAKPQQNPLLGQFSEKLRDLNGSYAGAEATVVQFWKDQKFHIA